ncbi:hypothetical protein BTJ44_06022 [Bacillus mycoides]|uniref:Uncharacterized protein n=1 Tax=Bacillus mycoides TaxID=1405 RepID=A0ABC9QYJ9_BACMY|nr:hypothetical protein III_04459 [Bacillus mycoides]OSY12651.1 hypothetical protein BTJ44_06022 [Bacillus mycoides]
MKKLSEVQAVKQEKKKEDVRKVRGFVKCVKYVEKKTN